MSAGEEVEQWKTIPGWPGYEVSNLGRVRSYRGLGGTVPYLVRDPRPKRTWIAATGYLSVSLQVSPGRCSAVHVHSLVARAFLGPRPHGLQVAHNDGDRSNARLSNLRYATPVENAQDKVRHGTNLAGERNPRHKVIGEEVLRIRMEYAAGGRQKDIARRYRISQSQVSNIVRGQSWRDASEAS